MMRFNLHKLQAERQSLYSILCGIEVLDFALAVLLLNAATGSPTELRAYVHAARLSANPAKLKPAHILHGIRTPEALRMVASAAPAIESMPFFADA